MCMWSHHVYCECHYVFEELVTYHACIIIHSHVSLWEIPAMTHISMSLHVYVASIHVHSLHVNAHTCWCLCALYISTYALIHVRSIYAHSIS